MNLLVGCKPAPPAPPSYFKACLLFNWLKIRTLDDGRDILRSYYQDDDAAYEYHMDALQGWLNER